MSRHECRIHILDEALANQIAAGEVVERPASVVKELLENAIDAGARTIALEIEGGGVDAIRVVDDGHGMTPMEAALAVQRHATSKITTITDLETITTLGFRGEALPSIASISRFVLTSRVADDIAGTRVRVTGGAAPEQRETGAQVGTTVEVRDLFFNVPARRKFLKSQATESAHVADTCLRVALARPEVKLTLTRDGRRVREYLPRASREERARAIFAGETLTALRGERDSVAIEAHLSAPERARSGAQSLHLFVNGRPVKDRALARAVAFAYGSVLPPGRFPTGVVFVELDPRRVDVNVHPQKAEVRFEGGKRVLDIVTRALAAALGTSAWSGPSARGSGFWQARLGGSTIPPRPEGAPSESAPALGPDPWGLAPDLAKRGVDSEAPPAGGHATADRVGDRWDIAGALRDSAVPYEPTPASSPPSEPTSAREPSLLGARGVFGSLRVLGQARRMLIVCEAPDSLVVIDQHAADERLRYHRLRTAHRAREVVTQRLLFPERVEVSATEAALVEEHRDELQSIGLDCAPMGPTTVVVHAIPALVRRAPAERLLRDVLDELTFGGERAFNDAIDMALATMACHGAIRAGDTLSLEECVALLRALDEVDDFAGHCPHGRPVVYDVSFADIERRLGR